MDEAERDSDQKSPGSHQPSDSPAPAPDGPPDGPPKPDDAHLAGVQIWCPNCAAYKKPLGKGNCSGCGRMLKHSFVAKKRPVNHQRVQQLLDKFVEEYRPCSQRLKSMCQQLAFITERLEAIKPESIEYGRLVEKSQTLGVALEESRLSREQTDVGDLSGRSLTELLASSERLSATLHQMLEDEQRTVPPPEVPSRFDTSPFGSPSPVADSVEPVTSEPTPAPERICRYCYQPPARCAETKATHLEAWRAFHHNDPEEITRRGEEATQVMLKTMRFGNPY